MSKQISRYIREKAQQDYLEDLFYNRISMFCPYCKNDYYIYEGYILYDISYYSYCTVCGAKVYQQ